MDDYEAVTRATCSNHKPRTEKDIV
jgi:hypothetical protein